MLCCGRGVGVGSKVLHTAAVALPHSHLLYLPRNLPTPPALSAVCCSVLAC